MNFIDTTSRRKRTKTEASLRLLKVGPDVAKAGVHLVGDDISQVVLPDQDQTIAHGLRVHLLSERLECKPEIDYFFLTDKIS